MASSYLAKGDFVYREDSPPIFANACGSFLIDTAGRKYLDIEACNGAALLGYDSSIIDEATQKIVNLPALPSFCESNLRIDLADKLGPLLNTVLDDKGKLAFELGGAQGVELAVKIAKMNNPRPYVAVLGGAYHGRSGFTSQLSASERYRTPWGDWRLPVHRLPYPNCSHTEMCDCKTRILKLVSSEYEGLVANGKANVCALVIEPILNVGGMLMPDPSFMRLVVDEFRKLGALIIVDEIFTGVHRTGPLLALKHHGFSPDIVVLSKGLSNGITPFSCIWAKESLMTAKKFPPGTHSVTFINTPFACSIVSTVIDRYIAWSDREKDIVNLGNKLRELLTRVSKSTGLMESFYSLGGLSRIVLRRNLASLLRTRAREIRIEKPLEGVHGILLASTGMAPDVIAIHPTLNISDAELEIFETLLTETFESVEREVKPDVSLQ